MIDATSLVKVLSQGSMPDLQQLPPPQTQDVMRFESVLNQGAGLGDQVGAANNNLQIDSASVRDTPVIQLTTVGSQEGGVKEAIMGQVAQMDQSYHSMLSQFNNMPKFSEYLSSKVPSTSSHEMRTYPEVSAPANGADGLKQMEGMLKKNQEITQASLDYEGMLSHWNVNSQMWMTKINVISSAVTQMAQGFKTLFRAGG